MVAKLKLAVMGTGALGKEHARIYGELASQGTIELAGIYDNHPETAARVAAKVQARIFKTVEETLQNCDALSIVTPP